MINVAILGFGVVGSGVAEVLTQNSRIIEDKLGQKVNIKYILDLREFPDSPFGHLVVHDFNLIVNDPEVDIVAEMMGGSHPAYDFSKEALLAGKSVVTSNKEVVANFGAELLEIAANNHVSYLFEASVGGGIPIIRPMCNDLASNNVVSVNGILNGTTNYILTRMMNEGADFDSVLKEAQDKGYAERNPAADVEGLDAARKIVILAALAYGMSISPDDIHVEGITSITSEDVEIAQKLGYAVKLIGHAEITDSGILAMVSPRFIPLSEPLASISGVFNGIMLECDMVGKVMFYGPGAGKLPTASAVCADIVDIAAHGADGIKLPSFAVAQKADIADFSASKCHRAFIFDNIEGADGNLGCVDKLIAIDKLLVIGGKIAVITADEVDEITCAKITAKLSGCKSYRIL